MVGRPTSRATSRLVATLRNGSLTLLGAGTALILALHFLRPDVHPTRHYISEYGNEGWSWMLSVALLLIAVGLLALARTLLARDPGRAAPRLFQAAAASLAVAAVFSTDRSGGEVGEATLAGAVHGIAAMLAFGLLVAAMAVLGPRPGRARPPLSAASWALPLGALAVGLAAFAFLVVPEAHGIRQRAFLIVVFAWLLTISRQLSTTASPLPGEASLPPVDGSGEGRDS